MAERKRFLRPTMVPDEKGNHFSDPEWNDVRRHLKPTDDEDLLRYKLNRLGKRYAQVLFLSRTTNPLFAQLVTGFEEIAQTASLLRDQLSKFRGAHIGYELNVAESSDDRLDHFFHANSEPVFKAAAFLSMLYDDLGPPLSLAADYARKVIDMVAQFDEPFNGKRAVVLAIVDHWVKDMQRPFPRSGGGTLAQFVFAAANPILRVGGQQIASVGATRTMLLTIGPPRRN
jgi:hypothetical protein